MAGYQNVNLDIKPNCLCTDNTVDVERTFLLYKHTFSNRQYNFQEHSLKMFTCNYVFNSEL